MIRRFLIIHVAVLLCTLTMQGQTAREEFRKDPTLSGDNYTAYRTPKKKMTAAPKGYTACYMSHYGRHGSRYLCGRNAYDGGYKTLLKADSLGELTTLGKELLADLKAVWLYSHERTDELTPLGAQQHRGIAHRMYENFPEIFSGKGKIDARSSVVIRCILSMSNELAELQGMNPNLTITMDAAQKDMQYICYDDKELNKQKMPKGSEAEKAYNTFAEKYFQPERFLNSIFQNESYWKKNIKQPRRFVMDDIWKVVADMQSSEQRFELSLYRYFTADELYNIWLVRNAEWYIKYGPSLLNGGKMIYLQRNLINNIISEADSCLTLQEQAQVDGTTGATETPEAALYSSRRQQAQQPVVASMRFGHEVVVMPTVCFLNLNGYGKQYSDLEDLEKNQWYSYRIFPMASNIQIIFYRKKNAPVLVKFLLNEEEATIPDLTAVNTYYYKWDDVKKFCRER